ncbi:MAG TPA: hypothetical protein VIL28_03960, partial [Steroidobacteraceae bacterium]
MDNQRLFVWLALLLVLYLNYMAWQADYGTTITAPTPTESAAPQGESSDTLPELSAQGDAPPAVSTTPATSAAAKAPTIRVRTDVLDME